jgi:flagellar biogenesis protein FliO
METLAKWNSPAGRKLLAASACLVALAVAQGLSPAAPVHLGSPLRLLVGLAALAGAAFWAVRRLGAGGLALRRAEPALRIVERTGLGPRNGLAVIEADGHRLLVAYGEGFTQVYALDAKEVRS